MLTKATALSDPEPKSDEAASPRQVSPEITEVLHLIGAMERLIDDVETRRKVDATTATD